MAKNNARLVSALVLVGCLSCSTSRPGTSLSGAGGQVQTATGGASATGGNAHAASGGDTHAGIGGAGQGGTGGATPADAGIDGAIADASFDAVLDASGGDRGVPTCAPVSPAAAPVVVRACVFAADAKPVTTNVDAMVTVTGVDETMSICDARRDGSPLLYRRLAVESAAGTKWTVLVRIPDLPAAVVSAGQTLQMTVSASSTGDNIFGTLAQTVVLSRQGNLVLFASDLQRIATSVGPGTGFDWKLPSTKWDLLPDLTPWGLTLSDAGPVCTHSAIVPTCLYVNHQVEVAWGGTVRSLGAGDTAQLGALSVVVGDFEQTLSQGGCDGISLTRMGGFIR